MTWLDKIKVRRGSNICSRGKVMTIAFCWETSSLHSRPSSEPNSCGAILHFTAVSLVAKPLNRSEARVDSVCCHTDLAAFRM